MAIFEYYITSIQTNYVDSLRLLSRLKRIFFATLRVLKLKVKLLNFLVYSLLDLHSCLTFEWFLFYFGIKMDFVKFHKTDHFYMSPKDNYTKVYHCQNHRIIVM
jgi:hypothetical protein